MYRIAQALSNQEFIERGNHDALPKIYCITMQWRLILSILSDK